MLETLHGESRRVYQQVFVENPAPKLLLDPAQGDILDANPAALRFYGYSQDELIHLNLAALQMVPRYGPLTEPFSASSHYIAVHRQASGDLRDVEVFGGDIDIQERRLRYMLVHDITGSPPEDPLYQDLADRFKTIYESAGIGIGLIDMNGTLLESNPAFQTFLGYTEEELRSMQFLDFTHPADAPRNWMLFRELTGSQRRKFQMEKRYLRKDGSIVWGRVTATLVASAGKPPRYAILMVEDISERKAMEASLQTVNESLEQQIAARTAELAQANDRLLELDRMKTHFLQNVSHELRAPVTNLKTYLHLLSRGDPAKYERYLGVMKDQIDRLGTLVIDLLDLTRLDEPHEPPECSTVDLFELLRASIEVHRMQAESRGLALVLLPAAAPLLVRGSPEQLRRIASNLISNAIKYTDQGEITVRAFRDDASGRVCLEVRDTGRGISAEDLPHIFERFYRGKAARSKTPGTGLGLSIVQEMVRSCGGEVSVQSTEGRGSAFMVHLPPAPPTD